jgi:hypothetical protein
MLKAARHRFFNILSSIKLDIFLTPSIDKSYCRVYVVNDFKPGQPGNLF